MAMQQQQPQNNFQQAPPPWTNNGNNLSTQPPPQLVQQAPPPSLMSISSQIDNLNVQQLKLREQIHQSESNLLAQRQVIHKTLSSIIYFAKKKNHSHILDIFTIIDETWIFNWRNLNAKNFSHFYVFFIKYPICCCEFRLDFCGRWIPSSRMWSPSCI